MHRYLWGQLRHRGFRALALLLGILVATTSFTVLTGTAQTSQLRTVGTVNANFRSAYDILVRPPKSTTALERARGLVQQNYLSGIYGGISLDQYGSVHSIPGVEVAAPIAMLGYVTPRIALTVDLTIDLTGDQRQLLRVRRTWVSDRGLSHAADADGYVYVTGSPMARNVTSPDVIEQTDSGERTVCHFPAKPYGAGPFDPAVRTELDCWSRVNGFAGFGDWLGTFSAPRSGGKRIGLLTYWPFPLLIAAIDPAQEAALAHLDRAVVSGRYLRAGDAPESGGVQGSRVVPVLAPTRPYLDQQLDLTVERLPAAAAATVVRAPLSVETVQQRLASAPGSRVRRLQVPVATAYRQMLAQLAGKNAGFDSGLDGYWSAGPVSYQQQPDGLLRPTTEAQPSSVWRSAFFGTGWAVPPKAADDRQLRRLAAHAGQIPDEGSTSSAFPQLRSVGEFDPNRLPGFSALSAVPLQTYNPPAAAPADAASSRALGGRDLLPDGNLGGYLQEPPLVLTTLRGLSAFTSGAFQGANAAAPISVIRVRVAGVRGPDPVSRERLRVVAQQIQARTGLDVDVTLGSSPTHVAVALPAGRFGRPQLAIQENWVKKGVAVAILNALDRKSLLLFALILAVCALFVANAAAAAVRARRTELGVLACLGWRTRKLFAAVLLEVGLVGLAAGVLGTLLALPLASAFGLAVSVQRAVLAVPAAVLLTLLAGLVPAWRASRSDPAGAVRPAVLTIRRARAPRTVVGLAVTNLVRTPGRSLLGALSLAIGVCALTLLLAVTLAFRGQLVGSLLGGAISVQIRGVDYLAAAVTMLLGAVAVADVLYLNIRERSAEFATLRAIGWREGPLARLVTLEGTGMGLIGSVVGAAVGLAAAATFAGSLPPALLLIATSAAVAGTMIAAAAAFLPATALRRLPTAATLAEE